MWSETVGLRTRPVWDQKNRSWSWSTVTKFNNSRRISGLTSCQPHALGQDWQLLLATAALRSNYFFFRIQNFFFQKTNIFFQNSKIFLSRKRNYIFFRIQKFFSSRNWNHAYFPEIEKIYSQIEWPQYASVQSGSETTCYGSTLVRVTWCCHLVCGNISNVKL